MQFVNTPTTGRRLLVPLASDVARLRRSPVELILRSSSFSRGFDAVPNEEDVNIEDKGTCVSEDEGVELFTELSSRPSQGEHTCATEGCQRVIINVSGLQFETQLKTLNRLPNTLLGNPFLRERYWDYKRKEYFFDRHRPSFQAILYFYQSGGRLKCPLEVPFDVFLEELRFFGFDQKMIDEYKVSEGYILEKEPLLPENKILKVIWQLFEHPCSSIGAKLLAIVSVLFIALSICVFCIETVPGYSSDPCVYYNHTKNISSTHPRKQAVTINYGDHFFILESVCVTWFIFELVVRFISCPSKLSFIKSPLNWIDGASIMPHLVFVGAFCLSGACIDSKASNVLSVLRILRVTRVLKLGKHSQGLQILGLTIVKSVRELGTFFLFLIFGVVVFSTAMFHSERLVDNSHFGSIPETFWWSIVSMTTVGYGDMFPQGIAGKVVGAFTVVGGILTVALPVPIVVTNFNTLYSACIGRAPIY
ncbi:potassium voltage-gated channel subfamily A member 1-like [Ylistrum balloti]|uniref:potassium voltage-gated channel subfamily A member 1-like n=1 Tax=Ylistrum balloti TaxID=509963 RepID=UPI002905AE5F|nr:potassium voltage-gated channel subfamily A member 1-like [Ylistrum balloti]